MSYNVKKVSCAIILCSEKKIVFLGGSFVDVRRCRTRQFAWENVPEWIKGSCKIPCKIQTGKCTKCCKNMRKLFFVQPTIG